MDPDQADLEVSYLSKKASKKIQQMTKQTFVVVDAQRVNI